MVYGDVVAMATRKNRRRKTRSAGKRAAPGGILTSVGTELRKRRKEAGLTQVNLSEEAGYSPNVVGLIERGIYNPTVVMLDAITTRLGIHISELFPRPFTAPG